MQYTTYLRWGILTGLFALLFIPFIIANGALIPNMFFPYITGKNFTFRIIVELVLILYVILALRDPQYRPKSSPLFWSILAFIAWMGIATALSVDPLKSFWSNFERMEGYVTLLHLFVLFVIAGAVLNTEALWKRFFQTSVAVSAFQGLYALFQVMNILGFAPTSQSGARADTSFGNATYLAVYMLFNIFITLYLLVRERKSTGWQAVYGIALVLQFTALYFTETRGAILGVLGGLVLVALYTAWRAKGSEWRGLRMVSFGALGVIAVLVAGFFVVKDTDFIRNAPALSRLASISLNDPTTQSRFIIWNIAYQGFLEKPVHGWGQENFSFVFNEHYSPKMYNQEQWFDRAHNQFLDWLIAGGLPAFVLFISFFLISTWVVMRSTMLSPPEQAVFIGLFGAYGFHSMFVFDNLISASYLFLIFAFVHGLSRQKLPAWMFLSKPLSDKGIAIVAPLVAIVILVGGFMLNGSGLARAETIISALTTTNLETGAPRSIADQLLSFKEALLQGSLGKQETVEQLFQFASRVAFSEEAGPEARQDVYAFTKSTGEEFLAARPNDARLETFMGTFLAQFGKTEEGIAHLTKALELSPNKQSIMIQLGQAYLQAGNSVQALIVFKQTLDLAPEFDTARFMYAGGLYASGQAALADALLIEKFDTTLVDNEQLLAIYTSLRLYERMIGIWKLRVEKDPKNTDTRLRLAQVYFAAGNTPATIAELRKILEINPALAGQLQPIITQIENGTLKP